MPGDHPQVRLTRRLMDLNAEAFSVRLYETAFHVLAAAVHAAEVARDAAALAQAAEVAQSQGAAIDAIRPVHSLSTHQAERRGNRPVYETLRARVDAARLRLAAQARIERARERTSR